MNTNWGPGPVNTNWGSWLVNTNWGSWPVNTNWGSGPVNKNWGPSRGLGPGARATAGGQAKGRGQVNINTHN